MKTFSLLKTVSLLAIAATVSAGPLTMDEEKTPAAKKEITSVHDLKMESLEGKPVELSKYKGKVLLIVNVASRCGATPQYKQLQELHEKYADQGLVVMGFPCNQFGAQEPGSAKDIRDFCDSRYAVKFPMFQKIDVNGEKQSALYAYLKQNAADKADIGWNFEKFIINKDGQVVARFNTRTKPDAPEVLKVLKEEMGR